MRHDPSGQPRLHREDLVLQFHSRSKDVPPGRGAGETAPEDVDLLELASIANWRQLLSNFAESPFSLDGLTWRSVEHCFQAAKFHDIAPDHYRSFALGA